MAKRKKDSDLGIVRASKGIVVGSAVLGFGGSVVGAASGPVGGSTAASSQAGLGAAAGFLPIVGTTIGGGLVVGQLRKLNKQVKHRK